MARLRRSSSEPGWAPICLYRWTRRRRTQITDGMSDAQKPASTRAASICTSPPAPISGSQLGWPGHVRHEPARHTQRLRGGAAQGSALAARAGERRGEDYSRRRQSDKEDEEDAEAEKDDKPDAGKAGEGIDFDNIGQRILPLPIPARNYRGLLRQEGVLFALRKRRRSDSAGGRQPLIVHKFELTKRKTEKLPGRRSARSMSPATARRCSTGRATRLVRSATSPPPPKPGEGDAQDWTTCEVLRRSASRVEADVPRGHGASSAISSTTRHYHGLDLAGRRGALPPYLDESRQPRRSELSLRRDAGRAQRRAHLRRRRRHAGRRSKCKAACSAPTTRSRTAATGSRASTTARTGIRSCSAPLTQPGVNVAAGEYLLAVNGRDVRGCRQTSTASSKAPPASRSFCGSAPIRTARCARRHGGAGGDETALRNLAWIEDNRRKVDRMSGRPRRLHLSAGHRRAAATRNFNRYYFAQVGKDAVIIDERFNGGGKLADYIIENLRRTLLSYWSRRATAATIDHAGGGDLRPEGDDHQRIRRLGRRRHAVVFPPHGVGKLIGKRTWGGLVGISRISESDRWRRGDRAVRRHSGIRTASGTWRTTGVTPDIEVELDPKAFAAGTGSATRKGGGGGDAGTGKASAAAVQAAGVSELSREVRGASTLQPGLPESLAFAGGPPGNPSATGFPEFGRRGFRRTAGRPRAAERATASLIHNVGNPRRCRGSPIAPDQ